MFNLVKLIADEYVYDQACAFGCRVESHAVYCESTECGARKCHRSWFTGGKERDEDCPHFKPNTNERTV